MSTIPIHPVRPSIFIVLLLLLSVLASACGPAIPQTGGDLATINLEMTDSAITAPSSASAGVTTISVNNTGQDSRILTLARLNTGVELDQFLSQLSTNDMEAVNLVSLAGGRDAPPGQTVEVMLDLKEGTYVVMGLPESDDPPLTASFQVGAGGDAQGSAPTAGVTAEMGDFAFVMPDTVPAGSATWEITNSGAQWHELVLFRPQEGFTQEQFMEMMMSDQEPSGPPPFEQVAMFGLASPGERGWLTLDLEPGRYWAVCFLPDLAGEGQSHVEKGMFKEFVVE